MKRLVMLVLVGTLLLSACRASKGIEVNDAWARASTQGANSAIYFVIQNHNPEMDELVGAVSDVADATEIHESKMENDVMQMVHVDSVPLGPSQKVEFMPGGYHVMLVGLKHDLSAGDEIEITLQFKNSPDITVKAMVQDAAGMDMGN